MLCQTSVLLIIGDKLCMFSCDIHLRRSSRLVGNVIGIAMPLLFCCSTSYQYISEICTYSSDGLKFLLAAGHDMVQSRF